MISFAEEFLFRDGVGGQQVMGKHTSEVLLWYSALPIIAFDTLKLGWSKLSCAQQSSAVALGMASVDGGDWPNGPRQQYWRQVLEFAMITASEQEHWQLLGYDESSYDAFYTRPSRGEANAEDD